MQQENHKLPRAFAMATNAPLEPIVVLAYVMCDCDGHVRSSM